MPLPPTDSTNILPHQERLDIKLLQKEFLLFFLLSCHHPHPVAKKVEVKKSKTICPWLFPAPPLAGCAERVASRGQLSGPQRPPLKRREICGLHCFCFWFIWGEKEWKKVARYENALFHFNLCQSQAYLYSKNATLFLWFRFMSHSLLGTAAFLTRV